MVRYFDPRQLILDQQEEEEKKVQDVLLTQERLDLFKEEEEKALRKRSSIREGLTEAAKIIRDVKFRIKEGDDAYYDYKKKTEPDFQDPREYAEGKVFITPSELENMEKGGKKVKNLKKKYEDEESETVERKYGDVEGIKPQLASYEASGTTGLLKADSTNDPYSSSVSVGESLGYAIVSGGIKIPYGFANLGAMLLDWADKNEVPVDQSRVARLERWFEQTLLGEVMTFSEEKAKENAIGRLTEVMVQMYGGWASVGTKGAKFSDEAFNMFNKAWDAAKNGKYVKTTGNTNLARGVKEVKKFNNLSKKQKFTSIAVGGGLSGSVVYDAENVGTFGDLAEEFGMIEEAEYTALDRKEKPTSKEDATRMLYNKLKFSGEMAFPIIPAIWGVGKIGKNIISGTFKRAQNATKFDRMVEKYVSKPFRARSEYPEEQFQAMQRLKGKEESAKVLSTDFLKNIDNIVKRLSRDTQVASNATGLTEGISQNIIKLRL